MAADEFFILVRSWLTVHLPRARRLSPHTIRSYKTAINTLLTYLTETRQMKLAEVSFEVNLDRYGDPLASYSWMVSDLAAHRAPQTLTMTAPSPDQTSGRCLATGARAPVDAG